MTVCPDCGRKKWVFMETPPEGHCATLELAGLTDCLRIALASERAARQAQRWEMGKERGQMNAALEEAARSLEAIARVVLLPGIDGFKTIDDVRPFARSRACVARAALEKKP